MPQFKPKSEYEVAQKADAPMQTADYALILGIRRIKTGSFAGLWELTELDANQSVKRVITDANTRSIIINLAAREIGKCL